jgi:glycosyltransferase involved in cell wall biosynthesis
MEITSRPLVSIVTPVYNGERYLVECIESVLSQTYINWEYIVVNNCSTDRTLAVAREYAGKDSRIRVHDNEQFLSALENHNHAFHLISGKSKYCKVIHADDFLFAECLKEMVEAAEKYPTAGLISSYTIQGTHVREEKLPYPQSFLTGREVCKAALLHKTYIFGTTPSTVLIRSDLLRKSENFYSESLWADVEACFEILQRVDFCFVHQVLTFSRVHNGQRSSFADRYNTYIGAYFRMLKKYGPLCLHKEEYESLLTTTLKDYYRFLGKSLIGTREKEFWEYHKKELHYLGYPLNLFKLSAATLRSLLSRGFTRVWPY